MRDREVLQVRVPLQLKAMLIREVQNAYEVEGHCDVTGHSVNNLAHRVAELERPSALVCQLSVDTFVVAIELMY